MNSKLASFSIEYNKISITNLVRCSKFIPINIKYFATFSRLIK